MHGVSIVGNDTVVETCIDPNEFFEVTSKHNLEQSLSAKCSIYRQVFWSHSCNFSGVRMLPLERDIVP